VLLQLDDAKSEIDLTIEARVQESLVNVRAKAKLEAEESLKLKVATARLNGERVVLRTEAGTTVVLGQNGEGSPAKE